MNKQWKNIIIAVVVVAAIMAALYFIPIPTRVDVTAQGFEIGEDGTPGRAVTVQMTGWRRLYLLDGDRNTAKIRTVIREKDGAILLDTEERGLSRYFPATDYPEVDVRSWWEILVDGDLRVNANLEMSMLWLELDGVEYAVSTNGATTETILEHFNKTPR